MLKVKFVINLNAKFRIWDFSHNNKRINKQLIIESGPRIRMHIEEE